MRRFWKMTRKQQEFYRLLANQMIDYNEDFHKEFTIQRIERIDDDDLKILLDNIHTDKDNIARKKGYITYAKFIYYADKMVEDKIELQLENKRSKVDELMEKRALILKSIEKEAPSIEKKNDLIKNIENKTLMFNDNGNNMLDECDYYIIEKFGFNSFFDENKNYMIKEQIEKYYKEYINLSMISQNNQINQLTYK